MDVVGLYFFQISFKFTANRGRYILRLINVCVSRVTSWKRDGGKKLMQMPYLGGDGDSPIQERSRRQGGSETMNVCPC